MWLCHKDHNAYHHCRPHAQLHPYESIKIPHNAFQTNCFKLYCLHYLLPVVWTQYTISLSLPSWSGLGPLWVPDLCLQPVQFFSQQPNYPTWWRQGQHRLWKTYWQERTLWENIICIGFSPLDFRVPSPLRSLFNPCIHTWLFLTWFWHVGDAGVGAHEDVAGVQRSLQEELLGVGDVNTP